MDKPPSGWTLDPVTIWSVSTNILVANQNRQGIIEGGTLVYIKASGIDQTASNNRVFIGPYECLIKDNGVNEAYIACYTSQAWDPLQRVNLPVRIEVNGKEASVCGKGAACSFTYIDNWFWLRTIYPATVNPGSEINYYGLFRTYSTSEFKYAKLGDYQLDRFSILQEGNMNDIPMNYNNYESVKYKLPNNIPAGVYNSELLTEKGFPYNHFETYQTLPTVMVVPSIQEVSQNIASNQGSTITIKGQGFGYEKDQVEVKAGDLGCIVKQLSNEEITCKVEKGTTETGMVEGSGVHYDFYDTSNSYADLNQFRNTLFGDINALKNAGILLESGILHTLEMKFDDSLSARQSIHVYGFFKAPATGNYEFVQAFDDRQEFWLNPNPNSASRTDLVRETYSCSHKAFPRNFLWNQRPDCEKMRTRSIPMEKDSYYYFEIFAYNGGGTGFFTLSVEVDSPEYQGQEWSNYVPEIQRVQIKPDFLGEQWSIKVWNYENPFQFQFYYEDPATRKILYNAQTDHAYTWQEWTIARFNAEINKASNYYGVDSQIFNLDLTGQRIIPEDYIIYTEIIDGQVNGETVDYSQQEVYQQIDGDIIREFVVTRLDIPETKGREWVFRFLKYRQEGQYSTPPSIFGGVIPPSSHVIERLTAQSAPVRGEFKISFLDQIIAENGYNGSDQYINYDRSSWDFKFYFQRQFQTWGFETQSFNHQDDGRIFDIIFNDLRPQDIDGEFPLIQIEDNLLTGGESQPQILVSKLQSYANRPFFNPIQGNMLFTPSANQVSNILVTVGPHKLTSTCLTDCSFITSADATLQLLSFTLTDNLQF